MLKKKYNDLIVGVFFLVLSVGYYIMATFLPASKVSELGPDFIPKIIAMLTLVISIALIFTSYKEMKKQDTTEGDTSEEGDREEIEYRPVIYTFLLLLLYTQLLRSIGFLITTVVYLFLQFNVLAPLDQRGRKHQTLYGIISLITTVVVYYLFRNGLQVMLPSGILG